jgi:hypothetical protein
LERPEIRGTFAGAGVGRDGPFVDVDGVPDLPNEEEGTAEKEALLG